LSVTPFCVGVVGVGHCGAAHLTAKCRIEVHINPLTANDNGQRLLRPLN